MMTLAADFGGTTIKFGLVKDGRILAHEHIAAAADHPLEERLEVVAQGWEKLLAEGTASPEGAVISLSLPFVVDPRTKRVHGRFEKFPKADQIDFQEWARQRLHLPLVMENDLRMALLGEWKYGTGRNQRDILMMALGTGIGCAVISNNRLLTGNHNRAAILLGHSTILLGGTSGRCGNQGCAEDLASAATLDKVARTHPSFAGHALAASETLDYKALFQMAAQGDFGSQELIRHSIEVWSTVVFNSVLAYDPACIILGGGVLKTKEPIVAGIAERLERDFAGLEMKIPILTTELGDAAALLGCHVLSHSPEATF